MKTIVVGGGLAGMTAAILLADAGHDVQLVEARSRLGGRVGSFWDSSSKKWVDYCQHVGMECCTHLMWWIDRFKQTDHWSVQSDLHFVGGNGRLEKVRAWPMPAPLHLSSLLWNWPGLGTFDRLRVAEGLWHMIRLTDRAHPSCRVGDWRCRKAIDWLTEIGQNSIAIERFWKTILVSALGESIDRVLLGPARTVIVEGFAAHRKGYRLLVPKLPLSELVSENAESILRDAGVRIRKDLRVDSLLVDRGHSMGIRDQYHRDWLAERIIVGVPWHAISKLSLIGLDGSAYEWDSWRRWIDSIDRWESAPITGIHTWWDQAWMDAPHAIVVGRNIQWIFACPEPRSSTSEHYYQIVISGSRQLPKGDSAAIIESAIDEIRELFPQARQARWTRAKVVTDPMAVYSLNSEQWVERSRDWIPHLEGLAFCGDWTERTWPATMEGAIRSGWAAVESLGVKSTRPTDLPQSWLARKIIR